MAVINLYVTKPKYLSQIPVRDGNLIFAEQSNTVCFDFNGTRYPYKTIHTFETEAERAAYTAYLDGYYFVKETNMLWSYSNFSWKKLCPDNLEPLVFGSSIDDFPKVGNKTSLYIADKCIFKYDPTFGYIMVSNLTDWNNLSE